MYLELRDIATECSDIIHSMQHIIIIIIIIIIIKNQFGHTKII